MPSQVERVPLAQFTVTTHADEARIRDVASRGMEVAKRALQSSVRETESGTGFQNYSVVGPGGFVTQLKFALRWEPSGEGTQRVKLDTGAFITSRQTFIFIPVSPKSVPGLGSLERFSKFVKSELEGKVPA
jgi:hypothetical protein